MDSPPRSPRGSPIRDTRVAIDRHIPPKQPHGDMILLTDPYFWSKVKDIDEQGNGTIYLRPRDRRQIHRQHGLPFDRATLIYYLMFSPSIRAVQEVDREKSQRLRVYTLGEEATLVIANEIGREVVHSFPLANIMRAEEENRPHDVLFLLCEEIRRLEDDHPYSVRTIDSLIAFKSYYLSGGEERRKVLQIPGMNAETHLTYEDDVARCRVEIVAPLHSELPVSGEEDRVIAVIQRSLPVHLFFSSGSLKFICWDFFVDDQSVSYIEYYDGELNEADPPRVLNVYLKATCLGISLAYWEVYVEPWLHLPHLLLNRPNPRLTSEILRYWSDVAGFDIRLETLERVIIASILVDRWDDDVWTHAQSLLTGA